MLPHQALRAAPRATRLPQGPAQAASEWCYGNGTACGL